MVEKYPFTHFMRALKSVQARDLTNLGAALHRIFSFLLVQRLAHDIDRYGTIYVPTSSLQALDVTNSDNAVKSGFCLLLI